MDYDDYEFIAEIRSNPFDIVPRLIYADYLEECGDARGELIRIQCELSELPHQASQKKELYARERQLFEKHGEEWLAPLKELGAQGLTYRSFRRGLIERVTIPATIAATRIQELCDIAPALICLDLKGVGEALGELAGMDLPPHILELEMQGNRITAEDLRVLTSASWTEQLLALNLEFNQLEDADIAVLATQTWASLRSLKLGANRIAAAGMQSLASSAFLPRLKSLFLRVNRIEANGLNQLIGTSTNLSLEELDLSSNILADPGLQSLTQATCLGQLKTLLVRSNNFSATAMEELSEIEWIKKLTLLDLRANAMLTQQQFAMLQQHCEGCEVKANVIGT